MGASHLAFVWIALLVVADGPSREEQELQKLQGIWTAVSIQMGAGKGIPEKSLKSFTLTIEGDNWELNTGSGAKLTKLKIVDATQDPKHMDLIETAADRVLRCLYKVEGDTLTVCRVYQEVDAARPIRIEAKAPNVGVAVFKRKPADKEGPLPGRE